METRATIGRSDEKRELWIDALAGRLRRRVRILFGGDAILARESHGAVEQSVDPSVPRPTPMRS
jgi:hypothetical protein